MLEHVNENSSANACHINSRVEDESGKKGYNFATKVLAKKKSLKRPQIFTSIILRALTWKNGEDTNIFLIYFLLVSPSSKNYLHIFITLYLFIFHLISFTHFTFRSKLLFFYMFNCCSGGRPMVSMVRLVRVRRRL